jgi:rhamnose utilization protein RhaD (predicted bifunctional aldolase and dehydrogenase)/NAD(P)-dependent dehydrogenase (short-subunit alcohol dehydrogenase family)
MRSLWDDAEAGRIVEKYAARGIPEALALRTYSSRLLGGDPALVLHGGGNTSVKTRMKDVFGEEVAVLCVKGSGWDLATIEPEGHPAVRMETLAGLRRLDRLSDEDMVNALRSNLLDNGAPTPSVEALLHAYVDATYIDHTHAIAPIVIADQPDSEALCREIYGTRVVWVPYVMPGFELAQVVARAFERHPQAQGMFLSKHGLFSLGATAREAYERMIEFVTLAEDFIEARRSRHVPEAITASLELPPDVAGMADVGPYLRAAFAAAARGRATPHWVFDLRADLGARTFACGLGLTEIAQRGVATPDHVIRMKGRPLVLPVPRLGQLEDWAAQTASRMADFVRDYDAYFERNNARLGGVKKELDPLPRAVVIPGVGVVAVGKSAADAAVHGDIIESWMRVVTDATVCGRYEPIGEADEFDMEYWSLEQAKLGKAAPKPFQGRVVAVTGGGNGIGAATARAFAALGADVAVLDVDATAATEVARGIGRFALAVPCDVTDAELVHAAFGAIKTRFGGVDIVVSNAGIALGGAMAGLPAAVLARSFEVNFFGHQLVAQTAVAIMKTQGTGGVLLFNVSKQAVNPGPDFGAYGTSKAALLALVRQYALEHGRDGIRVNAINADRIRSGLLDDKTITARSAARGLSEGDYMAGNLLGREVTAEDVAKAFVMSAQLEKTTGNVMTVDGGNVAAMLR